MTAQAMVPVCLPLLVLDQDRSVSITVELIRCNVKPFVSAMKAIQVNRVLFQTKNYCKNK